MSRERGERGEKRGERREERGERREWVGKRREERGERREERGEKRGKKRGEERRGERKERENFTVVYSERQAAFDLRVDVMTSHPLYNLPYRMILQKNCKKKSFSSPPRFR